MIVTMTPLQVYIGFLFFFFFSCLCVSVFVSVSVCIGILKKKSNSSNNNNNRRDVEGKTKILSSPFCRCRCCSSPSLTSAPYVSYDCVCNFLFSRKALPPLFFFNSVQNFSFATLISKWHGKRKVTNEDYRRMHLKRHTQEERKKKRKEKTPFPLFFFFSFCVCLLTKKYFTHAPHHLERKDN